ncbi:hypothetical protein [Spirosoma foliorum]|uniref:Uncharacterized protein n=1 Tax=Spirosoma foliorum TaxID=2710596 RepID=A0A7G5H5I9_9BACT|nr:hypothetical protein [Spirosoma foliorum]QMW06381.1 hypothetical protein H3H32_16560 [Spirosoma foliorum]
MKKLRMTQPAEGPHLAIVREFEDAHAEAILEAQKLPGATVCWEAVTNKTATTEGYSLVPTLSQPTEDTPAE